MPRQEKLRKPILFAQLLSLIFFVLAMSANAQTKQDRKEVKGIVKDEDGVPLVGVSITKRNTESGTQTDEKGNFSIKVAENVKVLIFSYVGYIRQEVNIEGKSEIVVTLKRGDNSLNDVVVIGYGTAKRKDVTGSVTTVKPKTVDGQLFNSVDGLIRGRAAGVQVQQNSSDPGASATVKIRGANSLRGDNEPLYVVDGVILDNVTLDNADPFSAKTANTGQTRQSGLAGINPQDIESIEVLKDASATAIYGSRGANGVVIITTKQGKGRPVMKFSSMIEFSRASKKLNMLDAVGYGKYMNDLATVNSLPAKYSLDTLKNVNWQDELLRTAINTNNRISVTGASLDNKTKYFFAGGFLSANGVVQNSGLKQGDFKTNISQDLSNRLKMNLTLSGLYSKNSMSLSTEALGSGDNSMIVKMLVGNPIRNAVADLTDPSLAYDNPLSWLSSYDDFTEERRLIAGLGLTYKISNVFSYKLNLAVDNRTKERKRWYGKATFTGKNANGSLGLSQFDKKFYQIENLILFTKRINKSNRIDGTIGTSFDEQNIASSTTINENYFTEDLRTDGFGFGQLLYPYLRDRLNAKVFSLLGRINYSLKEKYLITLSGRRDGSSKFGPNNKYSFFPSIAAAWKVSNEKFLKHSKIISDLKWRIGYGKSGNQAIDPYNTFAKYGTNYYVNGNSMIIGAVPLNIQNSNLRWETTNQFNSGVDIGLIDGKLSFTIDAYYKLTDDLLQTFALPTSTGFATITKNIGTIENKGIEFSVNANIITKKDFTWNASANISFNRNKITDLGLPESKFGINTWEGYIGPNVSTGTYFKDPANIFAVGQPIGMFYGYKTNGVFQTTDNITGVTQFGLAAKYGDLKYVDQNKDNIINEDDKVLIGNPNPKFIYGFTTGFNYKQWNLDIFCNGSYGNEVVNGSLFRIGNASGNNNNNILASTYANAWTPTNPTNEPRVGFDNLRLVDRYVEDASFFRFSTINLGYTWNLKDKSSTIKAVNFNVSGKNLFTITKYTGFDPEVNSFSFDKGRIGVDWGSTPNMRSFSAGINLTF